MTTEDVKNAIATAIKLLKANKEAISPNLLNKVNHLVHNHKDNQNTHTVLQFILEINKQEVTNLFNGAVEALEAEDELINTDLSDKLIDTLEKLQNRGWLIKAIALLS